MLLTRKITTQKHCIGNTATKLSSKILLKIRVVIPEKRCCLKPEQVKTKCPVALFWISLF